jgi:hypothetical protein
MSSKTAVLDVFFCIVPGRESLTYRCERAWHDLDVNLRTITPTILRVEKAAFQKERRVFADEHAEGPVYIVADDDCLPPLGDWLTLACDILQRHPEFAILSLWPTNAPINRWTPTDYAPFEDDEVMEHFSVGNIRVCRQHMLSEWPPLEGNAYDTAHCTALRAAGYRVGYYKNIKMTHLGEGRTSLR